MKYSGGHGPFKGTRFHTRYDYFNRIARADDGTIYFAFEIIPEGPCHSSEIQGFDRIQPSSSTPAEWTLYPNPSVDGRVFIHGPPAKWWSIHYGSGGPQPLFRRIELTCSPVRY